MCGRYVLKGTKKELTQAYSATIQRELPLLPIYNVAPTLEMPVVFQRNSGRKLSSFRWGLLPHWSKGPNTKYSMINARSETLDEKPAYRDAFRKWRCVVSASGFYEWRKTSDGKVPHYIYPTDGELFSFAGLYEHWEQGNDKIDSYTIITTPANETISQLHDRMR